MVNIPRIIYLEIRFESYERYQNPLVAQLVEYSSDTRDVVGSTPTEWTKKLAPPTNATKYDLNTGGQVKTNIEILETKRTKSGQRKWLRELTHDQKALILSMLMKARKEGYITAWKMHMKLK